MAVTVTLSDDVSKRLLFYARKSHLSVDTIADKLLGDALPSPEVDMLESRESEMNGINTIHDNDALPSFDEILVQIKAIPPSRTTIKPATKTLKELVADLKANPPSEDLLTFEEMWSKWQSFEQELKAMDEADALRDRLE